MLSLDAGAFSYATIIKSPFTTAPTMKKTIIVTKDADIVIIIGNKSHFLNLNDLFNQAVIRT